MDFFSEHFNGRERHTVILLAVVILFGIGLMMLFQNDDITAEPQASTTTRPQNTTTADSTYQQKREERRKRQEEHYRLQAEYYDQKDKFYRNEIRHYKALNAQRPHVQSRTTTDEAEETTVIGKFVEHTTVDANTADSITLRRIPGIGRAISASILRYRNMLGGFYDLNQLLECKFFTPDLLSWFTLSPKPELKKININHSGFYQLKRHPYINKEQTQGILEYIRLYGPIRDSAQLSSLGLFTAEDLGRLIPYLNFE
ncbi:MAG: helix-hairpin-helix domain-containing protein [Bacteroidaceae bacterium]|nr:helix-hairpin-helix domain-containing protein [Bacteroidaceae bacterium]